MEGGGVSVFPPVLLYHEESYDVMNSMVVWLHHTDYLDQVTALSPLNLQSDSCATGIEACSS